MTPREVMTTPVLETCKTPQTPAGGQRCSCGPGRYVKGTTIEKPPNNDGRGLLVILLHPLNILLVCLPFGLVSSLRQWGDLYVFWFNFVAMIPLAKILGDATEELAANLHNDMLAGLLNATFGNAVEVVIAIQTLRAGLLSVVKASLLGSVLSNTLLVLGMSFLSGGLWTSKRPDSDEVAAASKGDYEPVDRARAPSADLAPQEPERNFSQELLGINAQEKIQSFSVLGALVNTSMLLISCMSFSLVTVFHSVSGSRSGADDMDSYRRDILLPVSRISSIIIMMAYIAYIVFQLVTHKKSMADSPAEEDDNNESSSQHLPIAMSMALLCITTVTVAAASELLVHAIRGLTEQAHMSGHFIGIILLPIVGNACEHAAAVRFAVQDKLGLSVSIAVGSSTQIALFVVPFSVLVGWMIGQPMDLNFGTLNTSMITLSVIVLLSMVVDGQSNWLQGYLLCSVYAIIAVMYWYLPDDMIQLE